MNYSIDEYCDMYLLLGECNGKRKRAAALYAERYPKRRHPDQNVIQRLDQRLRHTGNILPLSQMNSRRSTRSLRTNESILDTNVLKSDTNVRDINVEIKPNFEFVLVTSHEIVQENEKKQETKVSKEHQERKKNGKTERATMEENKKLETIGSKEMGNVDKQDEIDIKIKVVPCI